MPYYITKETIQNEILTMFNIDNQIARNKLMLELDKSTLVMLDEEIVINAISNSDIKRNEVENLSDMLFQLKDYKYYLKVVLTLFLKCKKYNEIAYLINRTFVNHIGDVLYISGKDYDYSERYFDRFIEGVKYTDISNNLVLNFIFYINQTNATDICNRYLRPSKDFLKTYILEHEKEYFEFIEESEEKYTIGLKLYVELYTDKGLNLIINKYVTYSIPYENAVEELIKEYKHNSLPILENILSNSSVEQKQKALNLLKIFKNDVQINNFIDHFYNKIEDETIKQEIKDSFLNSTNLEFTTAEDFKKYVSTKHINVIDTSLPNEYPLYYNNGERVDDVCLSFIFENFKTLDKAYKIKELEYLRNILDLNSVDIVANKLYENYIEQKIITSNLIWVVAFIIKFGSENLNREIITLLKSKMIDTTTMYKVLELYAEFNNQEVLKLVKDGYKNETIDKAIEILKIYARINKISVEDYIDSLVDDYKLNEEAKRDIYFNGNYLVLHILDNLNVEVIDYASKNEYYVSKDMVSIDEDYYSYILKLKKEILDQVQRFKDAFYNFRLWDLEQFKNNILGNPLLSKIASTLVWGYYRGSKLVSVFNIKNNEINVILNPVELDDTFKIGILHPVELEQNKEIITSVNFEPFNQLKRGVFYVTNNEYTLSRVATFSGMIANYKYFIDYLKLQNWVNGLEVLGNLKSLVKKFPNENLLCEITFDKIDTNTISINDIRFYNLSSTISQGNYYIIDKKESLLLNVISKRTYSNVLYEISQACFN